MLAQRYGQGGALLSTWIAPSFPDLQSAGLAAAAQANGDLLIGGWSSDLPLAVRLGYDRELLAAVSGCLGRAVLQDIRRAVKREHGLASVAALHGGVVTVVQRFRSDLGLYGRGRDGP